MESSSAADRLPESVLRLIDLLRDWREGVKAVPRRKLLWLALSVFLPGWLLALSNWASWPLDRPWQLALAVGGGLVLLILPGAALWLVFRGIASRAVLSAEGYTSVVLWALLGVWLPHRLTWWQIRFESATLEGAVTVFRFVAADAILSGSLLWLGGVLSLRKDDPRG